MRFYSESPKALPYLVERCYFDAEQGRLKLACERLNSYDQQFPDQAAIIYAQGLLRRKYLGQGIASRDLFERSYKLAFPAGAADHVCWLSASNVTMLSPNEEEFRRWAAVTASAPSPPGVDKPDYSDFFRNFESSGAPYWGCLVSYAEVLEKSGDFGSCAATLEVALKAANNSMGDREVHARRRRAQWIRELDKQHQQQRESGGERFPDDERLALHEALAELDRALTCDPYDAELWNLKSAWYVLLERHESALSAARHAIEIREPYAKAHINAGSGLLGLGKLTEARDEFEVAVAQAQAAGDAASDQQAGDLLRSLSIEPSSSWTSVKGQLHAFLEASENNSRAEMERLHSPGFRLEQVISHLVSFSRRIRGPLGAGSVPMLAELLSDFTPETVWGVLTGARKAAPDFADSWLAANLYLVLHCDGAERRDAYRLLVLCMVEAPELEEIRSRYRSAVLATTAAWGEQCPLDEIVRAELGRIQTALPGFIALQDPIRSGEREQALGRIVASLTGPIPGRNPNTEEVVERRSPRGSMRRLLAWIKGSP